MTKTKAAAAGLGLTALISGGIDASVLNEEALSRVEMVAEERVEAKQIGDVVETRLPWKGEEGLTVKVDMGKPTAKERLLDKRKKEVITEVVDFGEGGFKVDILLNEKPDTNRFCYAIEGAENYDFFYQPPLTAEEIEQGAERPPEIEGSYAVYHKTLKNHRIGAENYATGKVMHIPRPQVWELNDKSTKEWAELSYDDREGLCVTARQGFLDTATYPVRIDPTFGYTSTGASTDFFWSGCCGGDQFDNRVGALYAIPEAGTITAMDAYVKYTTTTGSTFTLNVVGGSAGARGGILSTGSSVTLNSSTYSWKTSTISSYGASTGSYFLEIAVASFPAYSGGQSGNIAYDTGGGANTSYVRSDFGSYTYGTNRYSIYATYTASGGGGGDPSPIEDIIWFD